MSSSKMAQHTSSCPWVPRVAPHGEGQSPVPGMLGLWRLKKDGAPGFQRVMSGAASETDASVARTSATALILMLVQIADEVDGGIESCEGAGKAFYTSWPRLRVLLLICCLHESTESSVLLSIVIAGE